MTLVFISQTTNGGSYLLCKLPCTNFLFHRYLFFRLMRTSSSQIRTIFLPYMKCVKQVINSQKFNQIRN